MNNFSGTVSVLLNQGNGTFAVDPTGRAAIAGRFQGDIDFGGGKLTSAGGYDAFVAVLDQAGKHMFSRRAGDGFAQQGRSVSTTSRNNPSHDRRW